MLALVLGAQIGVELLVTLVELGLLEAHELVEALRHDRLDRLVARRRRRCRRGCLLLLGERGAQGRQGLVVLVERLAQLGLVVELLLAAHLARYRVQLHLHLVQQHTQG